MSRFALPWVISGCLMTVACGHATQPIYSVPTRDAFEPASNLVPWNSKEGQLRLMSAAQKTDFFQLANPHQNQIHPTYCGIATSATVLNAFRGHQKVHPDEDRLKLTVEFKNGPKTIPFPRYTQVNFFNEETEKVKPREVLEFRNQGKPDPGLTLQQLSGMLASYGLKAESAHADAEPAAGVETFRKTVIDVLGESDHFVIVNFRGKAMGAPTGGHISPLAAYHAGSDSVLILDVAGHKNPWYWAPIQKLYAAMHTKDGDTYRGWVVVSDPS